MWKSHTFSRRLTSSVDPRACHQRPWRAQLGASGEGWDGKPGTIGAATTWSLETDAGPVDLLFVLEPWGTYEELRQTAVEMPAFGITIPVVSLDDLIELKRALGRPKDLRVAIELEDLRRQRDR